MKSLMAVIYLLALAAGTARSAPTHLASEPGGADPSFLLSAGPRDLEHYFPSYLANGYFSTMTAPRGTEGNLAYMVAFMDYGKDDMARPAAIPGWSEIDYSTGDSSAGHFWMNQVPVIPALFRDYRQTLNMQEATLMTSYRYVDHKRTTEVKVTTFVSEASTHLAATQISLTPDFDGTVELSFALNLWAPYEPRLPLAKLTGEEMQEAVAAHNMQLVAIPPSTPDRAAVWYHGGLPPVPLRWVLIRDPTGHFDPQALLSTDLATTAQQIVEWFVLRWQLDVTFHEVRTHLGVETQRQWSDLAILRTTPALFALFSLVTLLAHQLDPPTHSQRHAVWYEKSLPTFADALAIVRQKLWPVTLISTSRSAPDMVQIPRALFERLTDTLAFAA